jgi:hypothetical protein
MTNALCEGRQDSALDRLPMLVVSLREVGRRSRRQKARDLAEFWDAHIQTPDICSTWAPTSRRRVSYSRFRQKHGVHAGRVVIPIGYAGRATRRAAEHCCCV